MKRQSGYQFCGGKDHAFNPNRRDFLSVGALGGLSLGLTLGDLLTGEAHAAGEDWRDVAKQSKPGKAKNIIQIHLPGGSAHQETFDPNISHQLSTAVLSERLIPQSRAKNFHSTFQKRLRLPTRLLLFGV